MLLFYCMYMYPEYENKYIIIFIIITNTSSAANIIYYEYYSGVKPQF